MELNEFLRPLTSKNFLMGLAIGAVSFMAFPIIRDSLKPVAAGAGIAAEKISVIHNGGAPEGSVDSLLEELKTQREFAMQQLSQISQQLSNLQNEVNMLKSR